MLSINNVFRGKNITNERSNGVYRMKLSIENIGIVSNADISMSGISVIAGENNSGKSTVGKVLYCLVSYLLQKESSLELVLDREFNKHINNIENPKRGNIFISENEKNIVSVSIENNKISEIKRNDSMSTKNILFMTSPFVIDDLSRFLKKGTKNKEMFNQKHISIFEHLQKKPSATKQSSSCEDIYKLLDSVCAGEIIIEDEIYYVHDQKSMPISTLATGLKVFAILKILLLNNAFENECIFILDEPEIHLHPASQLVWAELLVLLTKSFPTRILINTHSPYFLRAVQAYTAKYDLEDTAHYYFAERIGDFESVIKGVTDDLTSIYASLSKPFEDLQEIADIYI